MTDPKKERLTLTITSVSEPKEVGSKGAKKLAFKAKTSDGKELNYFTFATRLFPFVKEGEIEGDIETQEREYEGNVYIDRKLVEVYKDGQPIAGEKKGWQPRGNDPETRRSIERQTSLHIAAQMSEPGISVTELLDKAEQIFEWTATGKRLDKDASTPIQPKPEQAQSEANKALDKPVDTLPPEILKGVNSHKQPRVWLRSIGHSIGDKETLGEYWGRIDKAAREHLAKNIADEASQ